MRVNGLYGWVRSNDARSLALFTGFVVAFHVLALLALFPVLALFDIEHAPIFAWTGYALRWAPLVTLGGAVMFAVQMVWHVRFVRKNTGFHFVDSVEEPRLCRIVEPLAIAAGIPVPYVGVIDSPAMNAFACGIRRKDAVMVFTRGLIDGLDDDELAAVAAHEISHIAQGDIRLIAAANVCLNSLLLLHRRKVKPAKRIYEAVSLPLTAFFLPLVCLLVLIVSFLRQLAFDGGRLTRKLIASSREFIADAEAIRLTQNPAALVSALKRIDGRSRLAGLAAGQDSMMIDGEQSGAIATHPSIAARIDAIVAVTGSMALIAPARRDTRTVAAAGPAAAFGRKAAPDPQPAPAPRTGDHPAQGTNRLGLTWESTVGAAAALVVLAVVHGGAIRSPAAVAGVFDPRPLKYLFLAAGTGARCNLSGLSSVATHGPMPKACDEDSMEAMMRGMHLGGALSTPPSGSTFTTSGGVFRSTPQRERSAASPSPPRPSASRPASL